MGWETRPARWSASQTSDLRLCISEILKSSRLDRFAGACARNQADMSYRKVLLVDDDPVFRALAEDLLLDACAVDVVCAGDGAAAIRSLSEGFNADLIICDLNMPAHDGVTLIRALAERRYAGAVLIISGESSSVIEAVAKLGGMQGLRIIGTIRKPLTMKALTSALDIEAPAPAAAAKQAATLGLLDDAIERGALHPFFQAKVSMTDGRIAGAEALARIATSSSEFASPIPYVELAERNSRIDALTLAMARVVARYAKHFYVGVRPLPVSINVSPVSLSRLDFPDVLARAIEAEGVPVSQVTLEVTETRLVEYGPRALEVLSRLRIKGFGLSVDDFGTGYSNIDRLRMFPFTELKIDQSFTRNALTDAFARACVETSVRLAKELGLKIVAEGVETGEMWDFLAGLGIDEAQGFLMARPMPPAEFAKLLTRGLPAFQESLRA
jgi:EAL domain-containing protein (putative c-di-GMP-specific phosphodiesterase class I)/FixJ family two-component response regulator